MYATTSLNTVVTQASTVFSIWVKGKELFSKGKIPPSLPRLISNCRIWWFIVFIICLAACTTCIFFVYKKWEQSPVIVNFANRGTPIYEIPFPAVTICSESKSASEKFNFTKIMHKKEDGIPLTPSE
jgi:hypothetical protein